MSLEEIIQNKKEKIINELEEFLDRDESVVLIYTLDLLEKYVEYTILRSEFLLVERKIIKDITSEDLKKQFLRDYYNDLEEIDYFIRDNLGNKDYLFKGLYKKIIYDIKLYRMLFNFI